MIRYLLTGVPGLDFPRSLPHRTTAAWSRRIFPCLLAVFILLALPHPAYAQGELCRGVPTSSWNETTHDAFVVLYTPGDLALASSTLLAQINQINAEYQRLEKLFETSLMLPVTIRIYPTRLTYSCLNALAPGIPPDASHARIGLREMARRLGVSAPYLSDVEKDRRNPLDNTHLKKLAYILELDKHEYELMYDLVGKRRNSVAPDLLDYIMGKDYMSVALRTARDLGAGEAEWLQFVEDLKKRKG